MGKIREYDRSMRRRLVFLLPLALVVIIVLLVSLERSRVVDRMFNVGYEGPMKLLPEITILDETGREAEIFSEERHDMIAREFEVYSEEEESEDEDALTSMAPEEQPEEPITDEIDGIDPLRTYPSHAPVPFREDYVILKMVKPDYPPEAMERGEEGYVLIEVYVNDRGKVEDAWIRKARGVKSFEDSALEAIRQFEFRPIREMGKPTSFWISFLVRFELT